MKKYILLLTILLSACGSVPDGDRHNVSEKEELSEYFTDVEIDESLRALKYSYLANDPICYLKGFRTMFLTEDLITITPNPTSSNVSVNLLSGVMEPYIDGTFTNAKSFTVHLQLLFNEKIIHQWSIENYWDEVVLVFEEYLKEVGTYLLVCNFVGSAGCTASTSASFMVIKK
jgi:hypothetical protein